MSNVAHNSSSSASTCFVARVDPRGELFLEQRRLLRLLGLEFLWVEILLVRIWLVRIMPAFRVTCKASTGDELAYFQLMTSTKSSVMARTVLVQLVWPERKLSKVYRSPATRRALASPAGDISAEKYPTPFISMLNEVRGQANMEPVEHASKQSATIQSITKQYIAANREDDEETTNEIALGVMAGWDVNGDIIDADISSGWVPSRDPVQLLEAMLERPGGRRTLMDPQSSQVALGVHDGESAMSSIVALYAFVSHSLEKIDFSRELLAPKNLPVSVIVAPPSRKGLAWSTYAIIIVFPQQPKANIAGL